MNHAKAIAYKMWTIDAAFADAVRRFHDSPAIQSHTDIVSYAELDLYAARLAAWLRETGTVKGSRVALFLPRSTELTALLIAIARIGAIAVPLDMTMPAKRRDGILRQISAALLLGVDEKDEIGRIMRNAGVARSNSEYNSAPEISGAKHVSSDTAYIFFTSGSTGVPKGVNVPHQAITLLMRNPDFVKVNKYSRIAHISNPAFDALSFEIWVAILNGGCLTIFNAEEVIEPAFFAQRMTQGACDTAFMTVSLFRLMVQYARRTLADMAYLIVGGEALDLATVAKFYAESPDARVQIYNGYGPTEFATFATIHRVHWHDEAQYSYLQRIPIGKPVRGTQAFIIASDGSVITNDATGELYLAGPRIGLGYWQNEEETKRSFVTLELGEGIAIPAYATGDKVRLNPLGDIEFLGRFDNQVKIRGHRIEIDDVRHAILQQPGVADAAVVPHDTAAGHMALTAFIKMLAGGNFEDIRAGVAELLPPYMIPAQFRTVGKIPLTRNGKTDLQKLKAYIEKDLSVGEKNDEKAESSIAVFQSAYQEVMQREPDLSRSFVQGSGDSLAAVRLAATMRDIMGFDIRFTDILCEQPLSEVLTTLEARRNEALPCGTWSLPRPVSESSKEYAAASEQERLYFLRKLSPQSDAYNAVFRFNVQNLEVGFLRTALLQIQQQNPLLSAKFRLDDQLRIAIDASNPIDLKVLSGPKAGYDEARAICLEPFNPDQAGCWRALYVVTAEGNQLWLSIDHLVIDSWSMKILLDDISRAYAAAQENRSCSISPRLGHADYARSRAEETKSPSYARQRELWGNVFAHREDGAAFLLNGDAQRRYPRPGQFEKGRITARQLELLKDQALQRGGTLFTAFMTIWVIAICRVFGRSHDQNVGAYAKIASGGEVRLGDAVELI